MQSLQVLVVEDESVIGTLLAEVLQELGHDVIAIEATEDGAVAAAAANRPELMIVDARLRQGSGVTAVERILREGFIPHLFVSGDRLNPEGLCSRAIILQKPFMEAELVSAIARAVADSSAA